MVQFWAVVIALVIAILVVAAVTGNNRSPSGRSSAATSHTGSTGSTGTTGTPTTSPPTTTAPPTPQTLQSLNGSGIHSLPLFTVPSGNKGWLVHYLYDCASFGHSGNFAISVQDVNGEPVDVAANLLGMNGGSTYYNDSAGSYQLEVNSECNWSVVVQTVPQ